MLAAIALMVVAFASYWLGWPEPAIPHQRLPELWSLPVGDYLAQSGMPAGWGWVPLIGHSDVLNLAVMAMLAALSLPCLAALLPVYARRDRAYVALVVAELVVMVLAATGWISAGH